MAAPLAFGQIVWAEVADANGVRKCRPVVLVTPTNQIATATALDVVAITSRLPDPLPADHVLLPWHAQGHPRTGLNRRSAAVCTWVTTVLPGDVQNVAGIVPGPVLLAIMSLIAASPLPAPPTAPGTSLP